MIIFTRFVSTGRLSAWRWRRRLSKLPFACVPRQAKHTLRGRTIFIADTSMTTELLSELEISPARPCPNDSRLFELKGYVERRRPGANEEDALPDLHRAVELDPRNVSLLQQTAITYRDLRRYAEEQARRGSHIGDRAK